MVVFSKKTYPQPAIGLRIQNMKTIIAIIAFAFVLIQSGCTTRTGVSVGHGSDRHGIAAKGSTEGGVSAGVKAY